MVDFKKTSRRLLIAVGFLVSATGAMAQSSATGTGTATATVIRPITITNSIDALAFGNIVPSGVAGTLELTAAAVTVATPAGGITQPAATPGTRTAASFTVGGEGGFTYAITLPGVAQTITGPAAATMTVTAFTSSPAATGTLSNALGVAGTETLYVGGTLNVGVNQAPGNYTGTFSVTVAYN
ncbi:MAG: DUF4402 domain-containing protein [Caldimonas sp.]